MNQGNDVETFTCARCGYIATTKGNLKRHLTAKKICKPKVSEVCRDELFKQFNTVKKGALVTCEWCEKTISKTNHARHRALCVANPDKSASASTSTTDISTNNIIDYEKLKVTMKAILEDLLQHNKGTINNTVIINNNSNNINTVNTTNINNVTLNGFGNEDVSYLSHDFLSYCLMNPKKGMATLIENIHYNKDYPENHNVRCKSLKNNVFEKYINAEWRICDASNTLDELIKKGYRILNAHYAEHFLTDPEIFDNEMKQRALEKFRFLGDTTCTDYFAVKRDIRLLIKDRTMYLLESPSNNQE
jgi:hypothetical protein